MFGNPLSVGIDIGNHSVKAVVLNQKKEQLELSAFAEIILTTAIINDQHSVNTPALLSVIRKLKKRLPFGAKKVTLALPDSAVISKVIQLDTNLSDEEAEFAVSQALGASSPFPIEELWMDFFPLISDSFTPPTMTAPYQVFASRKDTIDTRITAIKKAGLNPKVMELQTHALLWLADHYTAVSGTDEHWCVVDVGKRQTGFCIKPTGAAAYHREIAFGTGQIQDASVEGGNNVRMLSLPSESSPSSDAMESFTKQLANHLKRQFQLYNSTHPRAALKGLWLCGGSQDVVSDELLSRWLGLEVVWMNPLSCFPNSQKLDVNSTGRYSQYAVAAGLALRGLAE